nr:peptidase S10, serine carboxypeptidase, alpha/beta hydrolase fold protein [Tanacetum cinerariifolium]
MLSSHFYLTNLLLDKMKITAATTGIEGRVVNLSYVAHVYTYERGIRFDKINNEDRAYGQSKLANILHANELSRRLKDNPVGTGYSFVEDKELMVKTDEEAGRDLTTLLIKLFNRNETLQRSPLYIVAESYRGKYAVTLGLSTLKAMKAAKLKPTLGDTFLKLENTKCHKAA